MNRIGQATEITYDTVQRPYVLHHYLPTAGNVQWVTQFNAAGQVASTVRTNDAYAWTRHYAVNRGYTTNGLNQYSLVGAATYAHDANGNLTGDGSKTFLYDIENRMVGASGGVTLTYDPLGRLFQIANASTTTQFLYDGDALVGEYNDSNVLQRRHVHNVGVDVPMATYDIPPSSPPGTLGTISQLFADRQGSIVAQLTSGGVNTGLNTYDEYGIPGVTNSGRFQYTGQAWLAELGLYYYKARIYSPTLGRFMQTDPIGYDDQFNLYGYVGNDPVNLTDPDGQQTECPTWSCTIRSIRNEFNPVQLTIGAVTDVVAAIREPTIQSVAIAGLAVIPEGKAVSNALGTVARTLSRGVAPRAGIVYRRVDRNTRRCYIGRCNSEENFVRRQRDHRRANPDADYRFEQIDRAEPGQALREAEQRHITAHGGPTNRSNPNGGTENLKNEIKQCTGSRLCR